MAPLRSRLAKGFASQHETQGNGGALCGRRGLQNAHRGLARAGHVMPTTASTPQLLPKSPLPPPTFSVDIAPDTAVVVTPVHEPGSSQVDQDAAFADGLQRYGAGAASLDRGRPSASTATSAIGLLVNSSCSANSGSSPGDSLAAGSYRVVDQIDPEPSHSGQQLQPQPQPSSYPHHEAPGRGALAAVQDLGSAFPSTAEPARLPAQEVDTRYLDWAPPRSPKQQHLPPSPPSSSSSAEAGATASPSNFTAHGSRRGRGRGVGVSASSTAPASPTARAAAVAAGKVGTRRQNALLARVAAATNWYELRAVLLSGPGVDGAFAADPAAVLAVLQRLAAVTRYDMRPPESAALGSFLERWLLQHTGALSYMGPCWLSLCLHSLAKLARALPEPPPSWTAAWFSAAQPYLLESAFRPKDVSLSLWALSRLQVRLPPAALQLLLVAAEPHLSRFNGQDLSLVALALSALQARYSGGGGGGGAPAGLLLPSRGWRDRFLARCAEVLPTCSPQALANLLHGVVRSGMQPPEWLLGDVCATLYGMLPQCTPQGLANVLSALAVCGHVPEGGWVERFLAESGTRMEGFGGGSGGGGGAGDGHWGAEAGRGPAGQRCSVEDLSHMAAAMAELGLVPPRWWVVQLYGAMERQVPSASARQLAQLLHAVAQLRRSAVAAGATAASNGEVAGNVEPVDQRQDSGSDEEGVVGRLGYGNRRGGPGSPSGEGAGLRERGELIGMDSSEAPLPPSRPTWASTGAAARAAASGVAEAAGSSGAADAVRPPRSLLVAWHRAAAAALPGFNPIDAARSLWALAALGERPPPAWLQRLLVHCRTQLYNAPPSELTVLLWSLSALRFRPSWSWLADCMDACEPGLGLMGGQDLSMMCTALVRLGGRPRAAWSAALLAALRPRVRDMAPLALSQTVWALYRLKVQPPPEWLGTLAGELQRRWSQAAAAAAGPGRGGVRAVSGGEELRHNVMLLWVMSKWLGEQRLRRRSPRHRRHCRRATPGTVAMAPGLQQLNSGPQAAAAAPASGLSQRGVASSLAQQQYPGLAAPVGTAGGGVAARGGLHLRPPPVRLHLHPHLQRSAGPTAPGSPPATPPPVAPISCRVSARMRRRRRATRPGSLVASLGGDIRAAAALRRRAADRLLGPFLDLTAAQLASEAAVSPQDIALLLTAVHTLRRSARRAARVRPNWLPAVLATAAPRLCGLPPQGLYQVVGGLVALRAEVGHTLAEACAAAAAPHLAGSVPAADKVALLRQLCRLRVTGAAAAGADTNATGSRLQRASGRARGKRRAHEQGQGREQQQQQQEEEEAEAEGGLRLPAGHWTRLVVGALRLMAGTSAAAAPLLRLHVELLKARVRLRKLAAALDEYRAAANGGGGEGAASRAAAARKLDVAAGAVTAAAAAAATAGSFDGRVYDAAALASAQAHVRGAVAAAAAAVSRTLAAWASEREGRRIRPLAQLPPVPKAQRTWIWARARRAVAARLAESSPVLVLHLVEVLACQLATAAPSSLRPGAGAAACKGTAFAAGLRRSRCGDAAFPAPSASASPSATTQATATFIAPSQCGDAVVHRESLLWLAAATCRCWRAMLGAHRKRAAVAWRRVLAALHDPGTGKGGSGLREEVEAVLPPGVTTAATGRNGGGSAGGAGAGSEGRVGPPLESHMEAASGGGAGNTGTAAAVREGS